MFSFTGTRITCWDITRTCTGLGLLDRDPVDAALAPRHQASGAGRGPFVPPPSFSPSASKSQGSLKCFAFVDSLQVFVIPG